MKSSIFILLSFLTWPAFGQEYPFVRNFTDGNIILNDSTVKTGQIKWFPGQHEKLKFRENEKADTKKYSPEDLLGFTTDTLRFASLFNLEVYAANYALLGQTLKIKHTFGQLLDKGSFNIYLVLISDYNAIAGVAATYPNFIFERKLNGVYQYAAYPAATRMKERKYETAKENLYIFF